MSAVDTMLTDAGIRDALGRYHLMENEWRGYDWRSADRLLRIVGDGDGAMRILSMTASGVLDWSITFDAGTPARVVGATLLEALEDLR